MKKEIKRVSLFNSSMFGNVRTIENENGEAMFCLSDVCKCLGIEKSSNIINDLKKSIINSIECSKSNSLLNKLLPDYQQVTDEKQPLLNTECTENQQVTIDGESFMDKYRKHVITVLCGNVRTNFVSESVLYRCIFKSRKKEAMLFQQWIFDVARFRQHALVERQPAQLAVEIAVRRSGNRHLLIGTRHVFHRPRRILFIS